MTGKAEKVEPELLWGWLRTRSVARGLPQPVPEHGGMRLDTGLPNELRRYVFARPVPGIRELASSIATPRVFIKACSAGEHLQALVAPHWRLQPQAWLMTHDGVPKKTSALPPGYRIELDIDNKVACARIFAEDGALAASGYAAEHDGVFIVDRIATEPAHQRRGMGKALMSALVATQREPASRRVLVATEAGRELYSTIGWVTRAPYSTVVIEE